MADFEWEQPPCSTPGFRRMPLGFGITTKRTVAKFWSKSEVGLQMRYWVDSWHRFRKVS